MIVFDLHCAEGHRFEGWFGSSGDFAEQQSRGLVTCPECGASEVSKAPMAPAVPKKGNQLAAKASDKPEKPEDVAGGKLPAKVEEAMKALAKAQSEALKSSEYVGDKFADESRAMHYGERETKAIHGKASPKEAKELQEEGISAMPIIVPFAPPDEVN